MEIKPLMTAEQLAEYLGLSFGHVRKLLRERPEELPPFFMITPTRRRWDIEEVKNWLEQRRSGVIENE